jgi:hypothetical protein
MPLLATAPNVYNDLSSSSYSPDIDSDCSVIPSWQVADDCASLEGYLDDLSLREHPGNLLLKEDLAPDCVEGSDVKELLCILSLPASNCQATPCRGGAHCYHARKQPSNQNLQGFA